MASFKVLVLPNLPLLPDPSRVKGLLGCKLGKLRSDVGEHFLGAHLEELLRLRGSFEVGF